MDFSSGFATQTSGGGGGGGGGGGWGGGGGGRGGGGEGREGEYLTAGVWLVCVQCEPTTKQCVSSFLSALPHLCRGLAPASLLPPDEADLVDGALSVLGLVPHQVGGVGQGRAQVVMQYSDR